MTSLGTKSINVLADLSAEDCTNLELLKALKATYTEYNSYTRPHPITAKEIIDHAMINEFHTYYQLHFTLNDVRHKITTQCIKFDYSQIKLKCAKEELYFFLAMSKVNTKLSKRRYDEVIERLEDRQDDMMYSPTEIIEILQSFIVPTKPFVDFYGFIEEFLLEYMTHPENVSVKYVMDGDGIVSASDIVLDEEAFELLKSKYKLD